MRCILYDARACAQTNLKKHCFNYTFGIDTHLVLIGKTSINRTTQRRKAVFESSACRATTGERRYRLGAVCSHSQRAGIFPLLEADDMVAMDKPDWKSVFAYIQSIYSVLK